MAARTIFSIAKYGRPFWHVKDQIFLRRVLTYRESASSQGLTSLFRLYSQQSETAPKSEDDHHSIIKDTEKAKGEGKKHEFLAETRMLLDIVAKSLYSEKEVFIRELISNASDALEKLRYQILSEGVTLSPSYEIHIGTDKQNRIFTIQDTGIGMNMEELKSNLGVIAKSGSKTFLEELKAKGATASEASSIIGQFGVGFYSSFMVAEKVEVYTKSYKENSVGYKWSSDGTGTYEIQEADGVQQGTKIMIYLKTDCREFADEDTINRIIRKYSNFVGSPVFVNGKQVNVIQPLWLMDPKEVTPEQHLEFYKFVGNTYDKPRFTLHYKTDSPLMIRSLLYFPEERPGLFELSPDSEIGVSLYSRKVLIKSKAEKILPKWLRFVKGVVDSEDIPLNLSRELLQNSALISKLRSVLTSRVLKFLQEKALKSPNEYEGFYKDYSFFLKEGIVNSQDVYEKEEIGKLLRFESSKQPEGVKISLSDYVCRSQNERRDIFYLAAPSRLLAETSPYLEGMKKNDVEVLFCYDPYDELVLMHLKEFGKHRLVSAEKEMRDDKDSEVTDMGPDVIQGEIDNLKSWFKTTLQGKIYSVKTTNRLDSHPCVVTVEEMAAARQFIKRNYNLPDESRYSLLRPQLEINPKHPIIKKLAKLTNSNPKLAELVGKQLFDNAMISAGLVEDPTIIVTRLNELLSMALEKH